MKSRSLKVAVAVVLALAVQVAAAQEAAPSLQEDPRAAKFKDVERGFFVGFDAGWLGLLKTPTADAVKHPYTGADGNPDGGFANGLVIGLNAGVDLGKLVAVSVFAVSANEQADVNYGAFSLSAAGLDVRVSPYSWKDRNGWERLFVYVHGRGGYARTRPIGLFGDVETLASGGVGFEYFTRLRHFSVGAAADGVYAMKAKSFGVSIYPTVRYTF
ncbi:MAG: adventurous gliding motility protein CglE [Anaeromyxobacteraceae bacterium]